MTVNGFEPSNTSSNLSFQPEQDSYDVTARAILLPGDSDPLVSAHAREVSKIIFECYVQQMIMFLGIPGNVICCVVFAMIQHELFSAASVIAFRALVLSFPWQGLSDRIHLLLFSLAVVDLINLLCQFIPTLACYIQWWDPLDATNWDRITTAVLVHISRWSSFVSGALIVVMSVDRCLSVVLPLRAGRILTYRPMLVTIVLTYVIILLCHTPNFLVYTVTWTLDPSTNRSVARVTLVDDIIDRSVPIQIVAALTLIIKPVFVVIVIVCCVITVIRLQQASKKRLKLQETQAGGERGETRITHMLLFLCVVYIVLVLPEVCSSLTNYFVPEYFYYRKYHNTFVVVYYVIFTASCMNSSANVLAYLLLSSKFRNTLKSVCRCCFPKLSEMPKTESQVETTKHKEF